MSHWRGTWRKKEFESVEKRVIKKTQFYDVNSLNVGKNDEELLRIYYFRHHQGKTQTKEVTNPLKAKKQWQKLVQDSKKEGENQKQDEIMDSKCKQKQSQQQSEKNFFNSSSSQFSNLSSFSHNKKFQK